MQPEKIAPGLLVALQDFQAEGREGLTLHKRTMTIVSTEDSPKPPRAVVFIHCDEDAQLDHLAEFGVRINQSTGRVRTAFLPIESLDPLSEDSAVQRIKPSRYLHPLMDVAPGKVNLPEFKSKSGLSGKGVVIGVVDSGIDPNHPAFQGRILRIWDQVLPGSGVPEGDYGIELSGAQLTTSRDTNGHGTHVAGIAAGADATYGGVAPEAELVIVKSDLSEAHIADGIRYIFRVASELGRPAVVNLSLGGHFDAHDGTDSLSKIIDAESGSGRIVCCAAGNEGNYNIHAQTSLSGGHSKVRTMNFSVPEGTVGIAALNGWYPGDSKLEVSVGTPGGFVTPWQGVSASGGLGVDYSLPDALVSVSTPGPDPANGDHQIFVVIRGKSNGSKVKGGIWQLRVSVASTTGGHLDVWTLDDNDSPQVFFTTKVEDSMKIGSPGAAHSAVTVASYTTKVEWTDIDGIPRQIGMTLNDISDFSSEGPLRQKHVRHQVPVRQVQKPDIAAPGAMIVSALSADAAFGRERKVNDKYVVLRGTSMATPFITGIVALLLQRDPQLTPNAVKGLLRTNSLIPGQAPGSFDKKWGFGLIKAAEL